MASEPNDTARQSLRDESRNTVTADDEEAATQAAIVLLGVKPSVVISALTGISSRVGGKPVISLAAGVRLSAMQAITPARVMRAMTNTPSAIERPTTALARGPQTTEQDFAAAMELFGAIGVVVEVEEQIDAVTALAGSGPALFIP